MFRIPNFYEMSMSFDEAWKTIQNLGNGDCLEGMNVMNSEWDAYVRGDNDDIFDCDDDWWDNWAYEANAFNVVYEGMSQLFGEAA
jgi:hypothetical protein